MFHPQLGGERRRVSRLTLSALILSIAIVTLMTIVESFTFDLNFSLATENLRPREVPVTLETVKMKVEANNRYGLEADDDWTSLMPNNHGFGFIRLGDDHQPFEPSLYHQLHCLNSLRQMFVEAGLGEGILLTEHLEWHLTHCLNYIRQAILCNADITLEPAYWFNLHGKQVPAASGMNVTHTCRNWSRLRAFVEDNQRTWPNKLNTRSEDGEMDSTYSFLDVPSIF